MIGMIARWRCAMTESEILISEARKIAESCAELHPAMSRFIHRLTDKYAEAVADALRLEKTIHLMTKRREDSARGLF
jgi:hypothetical protein